MSEFLPPVVLIMRANAAEVFTEMGKVKVATTEAAAAADTSATKVTAASSRSAKGLEKVGKWASLGAIAVVAASTMMASSFQQKMSLLSTAADEPAAKVKIISAGVLNLAQSTGTSVDQLAEGAYTVSKAMGTSGAAGQLLVLKAAAQGAKAENVDLATATNALTSVMMSYHEPASKAVQVENELIAASGKSKTTMAEFAGSLSTVIPVASAAHISFAQVGGAIATLTQHGTSAQESTQELANTIRAMQAPSTVAVSAMQQLGLNVTDVETKLGKRGLTGTISLITDAIQKKLGPAGTVIVDTMKKSATGTADLQAMIGKMPPALASSARAFLNGTMSMKSFQTSFKGMGAAGDAQGKQFLTLANSVKGYNTQIKAGGPAALTAAAQLKAIMGGATGMNTALMLGGENMKTFTTDTKAVGDAATKTGTNVSSWALTQKNAKVQMDMLGATVQVVAIRLGNLLLPAVIGVSKAVSGFLQGLASGSPVVVAIASLIGGVLAVAIVAYIAKMVKAGVETVVSFARMSAAAAASVARIVVKLALASASAVAWSAKSIAAGARWVASSLAQFAVWSAKQVVVLAQAGAMWVKYAAMVISENGGILAILKSGGSAVVSWVATQGVQLAKSAAFWIAAKARMVGSVLAENAAMLVQKGILIAGAVAMGIVTAAQWAWNAAMDANPVMLIILAIVALIAIVVLLVTHWKQVTAFLVSAWLFATKMLIGAANQLGKWWSEFWGMIGSVAKTLFEGYINWAVGIMRSMVGLFQFIGRQISNVWNGMWSGLGLIVRTVFNGAVGIVKGGVNLIIGAINTVIGAINGMTGLASKVGINIPKIPQIPSLDVGGTIPGATNQPVLMIGHGGEEVLSNDMLNGRVPISARVIHAVMASVTGPGPTGTQPALAGGGRGATTNNVTVNAITNASPAQISSSIGWELKRRG